MASNNSASVKYGRIVQILDSLPALAGYVDLDLRMVDAHGKIRWLRIYGWPRYDHTQQRVTRIIVTGQVLCGNLILHRSLSLFESPLSEQIKARVFATSSVAK